MKKLKFNIGLTALATLALFSCQDDVDAPGMQTPVATIQANTSIADLKAAYWDDEANYIDTIKLTADGNHVVIAGRVISSDAAGNIYKSLVIQDGTGALALSINKNSLYNEYRVGQEVVIDVTDMYIGKYSGLQQLGFPEYSASRSMHSLTACLNLKRLTRCLCAVTVTSRPRPRGCASGRASWCGSITVTLNLVARHRSPMPTRRTPTVTSSLRTVTR